MIALLTGEVLVVGDDHVVLDVNGVGYIAYCGTSTLASLPGKGEVTRLFIETQMRDSSITLYGFLGEVERDWFRLLQTVQGVGARVALAILSTLHPDELGSALAMQDKAAVARTSGVGPKLAQRIVSELKDKAPSTLAVMPSAGGGKVPAMPAAREALSALTNLGYKEAEATRALAKVAAANEDADTAQLIRAALQELSQ
ncbi:MAG: Holliday junction branch migration protein RuvA [Alphaproteobacteria bacterium]